MAIATRNRNGPSWKQKQRIAAVVVVVVSSSSVTFEKGQ
jgi:hypothetical protein